MTAVKPPRRFTLAAFHRNGSAFIGSVVWLMVFIALRPHPFQTYWAILLLLLAPLVLVPLALEMRSLGSRSNVMNRLSRILSKVQLPAALLLSAAFLLDQGPIAAALALPWLAATGLLAALGFILLWQHRRGPLHAVCVDVGCIYIVIGSGWAVLDRAGIRPLAFDPVIVLLTAIHFHYAGFALPFLTGLALRHRDGLWARLAGVGVIVSVPLVAFGITTTQLGWGPFLEWAAACLMAGAGILAAGFYVALIRQRHWPRSVRILWGIAAASLAFSMILAAIYGERFYLPLAWLDIPWMRALHGTANALGFGLAGMIGWTLAGRYAPISE